MTTRRALLRAAVPLSIFGMLSAAGCETLGLSKRNDDRRDDRIDRSDRADRSDRDDRDRARPAGDSMSPGRRSIPQTARKVREGGRGERLTYRADRDGRLFAYDADSDRVVYTGSIRRDEEFVLDPAADRADISGKSVNTTARLSASDKYNLYFDATENR